MARFSINQDRASFVMPVLNQTTQPNKHLAQIALSVPLMTPSKPAKLEETRSHSSSPSKLEAATRYHGGLHQNNAST